MAVLSLFVLTSCGDDDTETPAPNVPTISVSTEVNGEARTSPVSTTPGDEVTFNAAIDAAGGFNTYRIYLSVDGGESNVVSTTSRTDINVDAGTITVNLSTDVSIVTEMLGSTLTYEFEVVDDANQTATAEVVITVNSPQARSYSAILLAAPIQDANGTTASKTSKTFFSTNTGMIYSMNEVNSSSDPLSADIDFGYFYGSGSGGTEATLSDPANYPFEYGQASWGTRNSTSLRKTSLDASAFAEVTTYADIDAELEAADPEDSTPGIESNLVAGEVLAFETDADKDGGSKKGLILIKSITPGDGENGQIELDILVQEPAQ